MAYQRKTQTLPLIPIRGLVIFPHMIMNFDIMRQQSVQSLKEAMKGNQLLFLVTQKDEDMEYPTKDDLFKIGTITRIKQVIKLPHGILRVLVEGVQRAELLRMESESGAWISLVKKLMDEPMNLDENEQEALARQLDYAVGAYITENPTGNSEINSILSNPSNIGQAVDTIAANLELPMVDKVSILEELNPVARAIIAIQSIGRETEVLRAGHRIRSEVREEMDERQNDYYLREQMRRIKEELGDDASMDSDVDDYRAQMDSIALPEHAREKLEKEIAKLEKMPYGMAEASVLQGYIECVLDLPWDKTSSHNKGIAYAERILNQDHYGLEKAKERILEYLAVRELTQEKNSQILYFVGPPGVGKTSVAKSIARALGRKFERVSLGGVRDEAEIRGHRKTYIGAMPGRIIAAMRHAGVTDPVILLDEIDKMSSDYRGDPSAALLEVLDTEQNHEFRDHYIEIPYDLSDVIFIATANTSSTVPQPLLDRMEAIELSTYTPDEKLHIAKDYLIPKQMKKHGLTKDNLCFRQDAIRSMISGYTRESGVRNLERCVAKICRKVAKEVVEGKMDLHTISSKNLAQYLGPSLEDDEYLLLSDPIGVVTGLAWTSIGGVTLMIEVNVMEGTGKVELTGSLGDVMKESCHAAISYVRSRCKEFGISSDFYKTKDIHIHVPEGATPKDGPSAGIAITTALVSALTDIPVKRDIAMTGEVTIRGRVLPIGGLKEKLLAAVNHKKKMVILPSVNQKSLAEVPEKVKESLEFVFADDMDTVLKHALLSFPAPRTECLNQKHSNVLSDLTSRSKQIGGQI